MWLSMDQNKHHITFFYLLLAVIIYASVRVIGPYISLAILAFVIASLFQGVYTRVLSAVKNRSSLATNITIIVFLLTVIVPTLLLVNVTIVQIDAFNQDIVALTNGRSLSENSQLVIEQANQWLGLVPLFEFEITPEQVEQTIVDVAKPVGTFFLQMAISIGRSTPEILARIIIFLILLSAFMSNYQSVINYVKKLSPLDDKLDSKYITRSMAMMKSMLLGTGVIAFAQAVIAGLFLWIAGVPYVLFWILVMTFAGIIPLGAGIITLPAGIVLLSMGNVWQGLLVILGQIIVVANIDNALRPKLVSKDAQLSPALLLLGVFGGIQIFGLLGVVYGPVIMIFLTTSLEIYLEYYQPKLNKRQRINE